MRDHLDQFGDARIAVVAFASPDRLAAHRRHIAAPFPFVSDPDRTLYGLLGAERGTWRQVWSPGTLRLYARLVRSGRRLQWPTDDVRQLGADAVFGRDGRLRYVALPASPDTRPPLGEMIAALD